ncbi:hypothetical protein HJC23_005458 [Cyclotella cryptica]|uniref:Uncharacterized protein n=1 Tax=Cyclotella cryptica TaxID=29204 RepID=A0ABD3PJ63_9STRA|eukprot:CCRYP_013934-RA/>CCRYP_013934-RA protein AED:0.13 eAED:0.13 QI:0/-1/0/1/-1/1/1/0/390
MGLRPSVRSNSDESQQRCTADDFKDSSTSESNNNLNLPASKSGTGNSSPEDLSTPQNVSENSFSPPIQRQAWTARGQLLLNFHDVISRAINSPEMIQKCNKIAPGINRNEEHFPSSPSRVSQASDKNDYSAEANLIIENKARRDDEVRNKTIAIGLCTFLILRGRRGLSSWMKGVAATRVGVASRYRFDLVSSSVSNPIAIPPPKRAGFLPLALDVFISTTVALLSGAYLFVPRPSSYIKDMAELPLVEGKSLYAEMVCPPILKEYKSVLNRYGGWPIRRASTGDGSPALTQEDVSLNAIQKFAENCSKRSKYERALLEERHALSRSNDWNPGRLELIHRITKRQNSSGDLEKTELIKLGTVVLPSGGVPDEVLVNLDKDLLSLDDQESA